MGSGLTDRKHLLRKQARAAVSALNASEQADAAVRAVSLLRRQAAWNTAKSVLLFAPLRDELDIWPLLAVALEAGKQAALPRYEAAEDRYTACPVLNPQADLTVGRFGIREPKPGPGREELKRLDLILVPGLAFDLHGRRLGRGKGFYDRLLGTVRGRTCGVAFDEQIVDEIPVEPHDIRVDCILTPTRWVEF